MIMGVYLTASIVAPPMAMAWAFDGEASGCHGPMFVEWRIDDRLLTGRGNHVRW
jgi:hypothetical protein